MQLVSKIQEKYSIKKLIIFLIAFYIVGIIELSIPISKDLFTKLTPFALLFSFILLLIYQDNKFNYKYLAAFLIVYVLGLSVEIAGVETGIIFGEYHYGDGLGIKIADVPLMIGVNWLLLVYLTFGIFHFIKNSFSKITIAAITMVFYDFFVEQVTDFMDMWYWEKESVPLENYIAWFVISFIMLNIFSIFKIETKNKLSKPIFIIQIVFFAAIFVVEKLSV